MALASMYVDTPDSMRLRQGDVISGIYMPRFSLKNLSLLHQLKSGGKLTFDEKAVVRATEGLAVVISQCCEFTEGKRNGFTLGALLPWKQRVRDGLSRWGFNLAELLPLQKTPLRTVLTSGEQTALDTLREANDATRGKYHNVYLYEAHGDALAEPFLVDFSQVVSVRMEDKDEVQKLKSLELTPQTRRQFQLKLGAFYARKAE